MTQRIDEKFINLALNLSRKNVGITKENPSVGCVIVKNNTIISTGITAKNGRPHAEIEAINKISDKEILVGATLYVSLEPCSHFGETSPCAEEIIKYKFSRVVICSIDPDARVHGNGVQILQKSGIKVEIGMGEKEAQNINRGFFQAKLKNKPFVTLKIATSLDGKIATKNFQSKWITSENSRKFGNFLRSKNQAILVGANTVRIDNPSLDCRILGLEEYSPKKIIICKNLDFTFTENIFIKNPQIATIILCPASQKNHPNLEKFLQKNSQNLAIFCEEIDNKIDLEKALEKLHEIGINSILIEGGSSIITQFLQKNLVDELIWIQAGIIIGNDGLEAVGKLGITDLNHTINNFQLQKFWHSDNDFIRVFGKILS
jgi:diaminohydroxyphosphoribosylaminopyrimidine deaminase/5-amino-6-(5-phosphoribosylamino)uracil reductase